MQRKLLFSLGGWLFLLMPLAVCAQTGANSGHDPFAREAERRRDQFLSCILRIVYSKTSEEKLKVVDQGIVLFEKADTPVIQISNARRNTVNSFSPRNYFKRVAENYTNPLYDTDIEFFNVSNITITDSVKDKKGRVIKLIGRFTFEQNFRKCVLSFTETNPEKLTQTHTAGCYGDRTLKEGFISITPTMTSTGLNFVVLLCAIKVLETHETSHN